MTTEPTRSSSELAHLLSLLTRAGGQMGGTELTDALWLARHCGAPTDGSAGGTATPSTDRTSTTADRPLPSTRHNAGVVPPQQYEPDGRTFAVQPRHAQAEDDLPGTALLAPLPPMLARPLALQRALRPLRRRVPSPLNLEFDEAATAQQIARHGAQAENWRPVLRPRSERWLTLYLVHDSGPTMPVWRPLLKELHRAFEQSGAFRRVELLEATTDGRLRHLPGGRRAGPPPRDGRTVALVFSDCSGPQWYLGRGEAERWYRTLDRWARALPIAVVQPLPERLWRRTALPGIAGLLTADGAARPNPGLRFAPFDLYAENPAGLPVPVLEASARWFGNWARLVAGPRGMQVPGVTAALPTEFSAPPPPAATGSDPRTLEPEKLVLNFRSHASPQALDLAAHLAVGDPRLPVMRLIQAATTARPEPHHLAEVVLSGLLTTLPGTPPAAGRYKFRPGVREVLLRMLPRSEAARIGVVLHQYAGKRAGELPVLVVDSATDRLDTEPLAVVGEETVQRLDRAQKAVPDHLHMLVNGHYRLTERLLTNPTSTLWEAVDERTGQKFHLKLFNLPLPYGQPQETFLEEAKLLTSLRLPGVAQIENRGFHQGRPYLVTRRPEGEDVAHMTRRYGPLPWGTAISITVGVAETLAVLHHNGLTHLDVSPSTVLLRQDGSVVLADPGLGTHGTPSEKTGSRLPVPPPAQPTERQLDFHSLGKLLHLMATGTAPDAYLRNLHFALENGAEHLPPVPGLPAEYGALVGALLTFGRTNRSGNESELMARLRAMLARDTELDQVAHALLAADPHGTRMGRLLRESIDYVLDGPRTGRYDLATAAKTEKVYLPTRVEIDLGREFGFEAGRVMDFSIANAEVDLKFSSKNGDWVFPRETVGHLCLLVWADDDHSRWGAGLFRPEQRSLSPAANRDGKRRLSRVHQGQIHWLWDQAPLPENILLHMAPDDRDAVLRAISSTGRVVELLRRTQRRLINSTCVRTVARRQDAARQIRDARPLLREEGIVVLGRPQNRAAEALGLPVPSPSEWVAARVTPQQPHHGSRPAALLADRLFVLADPDDPVTAAPNL
ncbi:NaeI family type II restriction endonuclease [Kitasatospora sp. NPDC001540]|uniref:NaeI family type II restriction endonuclease n=1 Tax=Kitasatospora sp. NPDC001540 TaxID=3364014 RepID=UPI00367AF8F8